MSSYFVNSFCGRYPNGPDYQLHNYGDHSSVSEQYRDSASMHSGRYGYGYNGMDLSVGRSASTHFGANERPRSYPANTTSASTEPRYNQSATASHSPPPDPLPCTAVAGSPVSESHHGVKNSLANSTSTSSNSSSNTHISRDGVGTSSGTEEDTPASSEQASAPTDQSTAQPSQPQIYPWMRKLHISHGKANTLFFLYFSGGKGGFNVNRVAAPSKVGERRKGGEEGVRTGSLREQHNSARREVCSLLRASPPPKEKTSRPQKPSPPGSQRRPRRAAGEQKAPFRRRIGSRGCSRLSSARGILQRERRG